MEEQARREFERDSRKNRLMRLASFSRRMMMVASPMNSKRELEDDGLFDLNRGRGESCRGGSRSGSHCQIRTGKRRMGCALLSQPGKSL